MEKNQATREVISSINQDVLVAVIANFEIRINLCIEQHAWPFRALVISHIKHENIFFY